LRNEEISCLVYKQYKQQKSKNKDDRNKSMIEVLENNGIRNSQDVLKQLIDCSKDVVDKNKLHVKEIKLIYTNTLINDIYQ
jgi:hypothetical protein